MVMEMMVVVAALVVVATVGEVVVMGEVKGTAVKTVAAVQLIA